MSNILPYNLSRVLHITTLLLTLFLFEPQFVNSKEDPAYQPPIIEGLAIYPNKPLNFEFLIHRGQKHCDGNELKNQSEKLIKYFFTALTVPEQDAWVNLSPTEKDRIISESLGKTEMGRDMLDQDYQLKQLVASLTNPETSLGQAYWQQMKADKMDSQPNEQKVVSKVWIMPDKATVVVKDDFIYIAESHLGVMLEGDDLDQVFKKMILPVIEKEVNEGERFAATRQIYHSVILSAWFKRALKDSVLGQIYVDRNKVAGDQANDPNFIKEIYHQYFMSFAKGAYNLIHEDSDASGEMIPRKYFSGGYVFNVGSILNVTSSSAAIAQVTETLQHFSTTTELVWVASSGNVINDSVSPLDNMLTPLPKDEVINEALGLDNPIYLRAGGHDYVLRVNQEGHVEIRAGSLAWENGSLSFIPAVNQSRILELNRPLIVGRYESNDAANSQGKFALTYQFDPQLSRQQFTLTASNQKGYAVYFQVALTHLASQDNPTYIYDSDALAKLAMFRSQTGVLGNISGKIPISAFSQRSSIEFNAENLNKMIQDYLSQATIPQGTGVAHVFEIALDPKTHRIDSQGQVSDIAYKLKMIINPNRTLAFSQQTFDQMGFIPFNLLQAMEEYNHSILHQLSDFALAPGEAKKIYFTNGNTRVVILAHILNSVLAPYTLQFDHLPDGSVHYQMRITLGAIDEQGVLKAGQTQAISLNPFSRSVEDGFQFNPRDDVRITLMNISQGPLIISNTSHSSLNSEVMTASTPRINAADSQVGGITFNTKFLNMLVEHDAQRQRVVLTPEEINQIPMDGISPQILGIRTFSQRTIPAAFSH